MENFTVCIFLINHWGLKLWNCKVARKVHLLQEPVSKLCPANRFFSAEWGFPVYKAWLLSTVIHSDYPIASRLCLYIDMSAVNLQLQRISGRADWQWAVLGLNLQHQGDKCWPSAASCSSYTPADDQPHCDDSTQSFTIYIINTKIWK